MTDVTYARIRDRYGFEFAVSVRLFVHLRSLILDNETARELLGLRAAKILSYLRSVHRELKNANNQ